ncbi:MAG: glycine zipper domain-containing protein [Geminicoccaceae bacterium]
MRRYLLLVPVAGALVLGGCSDMSTGQQRTLSGAGIGAAAGTVAGAIAGHTLWGAAIGAAAGAAGGFLYNQYEDSKQKAFDQGYAAGQKSATN